MVMVCRDEEINFKSNLALWLPIVDYFIFLIDSRTKDNSYQVIEEILSRPRRGKFKILTYEFEGFGQARTQVLNFQTSMLIPNETILRRA